MSGLEMKYFVLKPRGAFDDPYAKASREAIKAYADAIQGENVQLCHELHQWVIKEQGAANEADLIARLSTDKDHNGEPQ